MLYSRKSFSGRKVMDYKQAISKFMPLTKKATDVQGLVISILFYVIASTIAGLVLAIVGKVIGIIPILGTLVSIVLGIVGTLIGIYCMAGIVIAILYFCKVIEL